MEKKLTSIPYLLGLTIAIVFVSAIVAIYWYARVFSGGFSSDPGDWGNFGGYIGGVLGTLISFCALCVLFVTMHMQQKELSATQQMLIEQNGLIQKQAFENTYFNMLSIFLSSRSKINERAKSKNIYDGIGVDIWFYANLELLSKLMKLSDYQNQKKRDKEWLERDLLCRSDKEALAQYTSPLLAIFKYLVVAEIATKENYVSLLASYLNEYEFIIIFFWGILKEDFGGYAKTVGLFEKMPLKVKDQLEPFFYYYD